MDSDEDRRRDRFHNERGDYHSRKSGSRDYRDAPSRKRPRDDSESNSRSSRDLRTNGTAARVKEEGPIIQTFKQWIIQQANELIMPEAATAGYNTYKLGERKRHVEQFFLDHKDEEWFREKYHPEDSVNLKNAKDKYIKERFAAWMALYEAGVMKNLGFSLEHQSKIAKILDASIMIMEGCTLDDAINFINDGATMKKAPKEVKPVAAEPESAKPESLPETSEPAKEEGEAEVKPEGETEETKPETEKPAEPEKKEEKEDDEDQEDGELMETKRPKQYKSLFIKSLPPLITKNDLVSVSKRYAGFVRVAFEQIPQDAKFNRRAWITFDANVNIKDICWNLNNIRLKEVELGAVVSKDVDLRERVRTIIGISNHSPIAFRDLTLAVKVCEIADQTLANWGNQKKKPEKTEKTEEEMVDEDEEEAPPTFWGEGGNTLLTAAKKFIADFEDMYDEKISEINKYIPKEKPEDGEDLMVEPEIVSDIFDVLDPLLFYLRIVHSIDFYGQVEYSQFEDEHSCRCEKCHVRAGLPMGDKGISMANVQSFSKKFGEKVELNLLKEKVKFLSDAEAIELGKKTAQDEVEKFVEDNCQQIDSDKYMCPLSGKKFRGKEYVKKHIFNKHADKLEIVKRDCEYFNAFVVDAFKAGPPEPKFSIKSNLPRKEEERNGRSSQTRDDRAKYSYHKRESSGYRNDRGSSGPRGALASHGTLLSGRARDQMLEASGGRDIVDYRDLDNPNDTEMFG